MGILNSERLKRARISARTAFQWLVTEKERGVWGSYSFLLCYWGQNVYNVHCIMYVYILGVRSRCKRPISRSCWISSWTPLVCSLSKGNVFIRIGITVGTGEFIQLFQRPLLPRTGTSGTTVCDMSFSALLHSTGLRAGCNPIAD